MKKLLFIMLTFTCLFETLGVELQAGISYVVSSGSIETTTGEILRNGERIKVLGFQNKWAVRFQRLDHNLEPTGPEFLASEKWTSVAVRYVDINDAVSPISGQQREATNRVEPKEDCPPMIRPLSRPAQLMARYESVPSDIEFKNADDVDKYFSCWRKSNSLLSDYRNTYRPSLQNASRAYATSSDGELSEDQVTTLLSCLISRESAHWEGGTSNRGAVGLGQMVGNARTELRGFLSFTPRNGAVARYDRRIQTQRDEHAAGRLSSSALRENIRVIEAEKRNYLRALEVHNLWMNTPVANRPTSGDITADYVSNNRNHQAIIALSTLLLKNCEIRLKDSGYEMSPQMRLFACTGAYNMGVGGFSSNAMDSRGPQTLERWIQNLSNSNSSQKDETINHLISINRCMRKDQNYPPCGTDSDTCKESGLRRFNACSERPDPMCIGEVSRCNSR